MSYVKWPQGGGRGSVTIDDTAYAVGGGWVLDIVTSSGSTQMFLSTAYPNPGSLVEADPPVIGFDALTEADSDGTADALQSAVNGLDGVTDSTLTPFSISGGGASLLFDSAEWASFTFTITLPTEFSDQGVNSDSAQLTTASPADGILSSGDVDTVNAALVTYMEGLDTVTACAVVQQAVTPDTAVTFAPAVPSTPSFAAVGSPISPTISGKTFTLVPGAAGDFILFGVVCAGTTADWATALSSSNVTWSALGSHFVSSGSGNNVTEALFIGHVTSASSATVTITTNLGSPTIRAGGQEFSSAAGFAAVTLDASGTVDVASAGKFPAVTPGHGAGDLYWSFIYDNGTGIAGTTSGYSYHLDGNGNLQCYNLSCANSLQQPNIGDANGTTGIAVLLYA